MSSGNSGLGFAESGAKETVGFKKMPVDDNEFYCMGTS